MSKAEKTTGIIIDVIYMVFSTAVIAVKDFFLLFITGVILSLFAGNNVCQLPTT